MKKPTPKIEVLYGCIYVFKNILSEQECDELLEHFDKVEKSKATTVGYKMPSINSPGKLQAKEFNDESVRKGSLKFDRDLYKVPYGERLVMALDGYASEFGIKLFDDDVDFQLAIYDNVGDKFNGHKDQDLSLLSFYSDIRKMSASLQLSRPEEYEGADLWLSPDGKTKTSALTEKGSFTVFPSFVMHGIDPLKSGKRLALVLWYKGPAWR